MYRVIINKIGRMTSEEDVFKLLTLERGRASYDDNRLVIFDEDVKAMKLSLFLPKMKPDPKTKKDDGLKSFVVGENSSNSKHVLRIRYYSGNCVFLMFRGKKAKERSRFMVNEYKKAKSQKMETFKLQMGKLPEYKELNFHLIENYEKMRLDYIKPRVFGLQKPPYQKYYVWLKYEKNMRKTRRQKEVIIKRKKSQDYFNTDINFDELILDLGYDPLANFAIVDQTDRPPRSGDSFIPILGPDLAGAQALAEAYPLDDDTEIDAISPKVSESLDVFDIYDTSNPSLRTVKLNNLPKLQFHKPRARDSRLGLGGSPVNEQMERQTRRS